MPTLADYVIQFRAVGAHSAQQAITSVQNALAAASRATSFLSRTLSQLTSPIRALGRAITHILSPANILSGIGMGLGQGLYQSFAQGISSAIQLASQVESLNVSFRVLLGSADAAEKLLADINKFAAETPFEQMELAEVAKQLLAYGVGVDEVMGVIRRLGDIAALSGSRLDDLAAVYGKIRAQGRLTSETLESWQSRGIPIARELAAIFGVTESEIRDLVSEGAVGFEHVQEAIRRLTDQGGQFAGGMAELAQTTAGLWSTITGNLKTFLANLGTSIISTFRLKDAMATLGSWLGTAGDKVNEVLAPVSEWLSSVVTQAAGMVMNFWSKWGVAIREGALTLWTFLRTSHDMFITVFMNIWNRVQPIISTLASYVVNALQYLGNAIRGFFGLTGEITGNWVADYLMFARFVLENWELAFSIMFERFRLFISNIPAYLEAAFTNLVELMRWLGRNWKEVLVDVFNFWVTVTQNALTNLSNLLQSFWNWLQTGQWEYAWKPLTEGFQATVDELPEFVAPAVKETTDRLNTLMNEWQTRWEEYKRNTHTAVTSAAETPTTGTTAAATTTGIITPTTPATTAVGAASIAARFVGFAELARQMQQDVARELQKRTAENTQKTAEAISKVAQAVEGNALRVRVENQVTASYA